MPKYPEIARYTTYPKYPKYLDSVEDICMGMIVVSE